MKHIEIAGKSYPISFGYGALMDYEAITGKSAIALLTSGVFGITEIISLVACGLTNGADETGAPHSFKPKDVARLFDQMTQEQVSEVITATVGLLAAAFPTDTEAKKKTVTMQPTRAQRRRAV